VREGDEKSAKLVRAIINTLNIICKVYLIRAAYTIIYIKKYTPIVPPM
jgi:hypothetical protein